MYLPTTPIRYDAPQVAEGLRLRERVFNRYDAEGYRILEAARLSAATLEAAWKSVQQFPSIWAQLKTTGGHREVVARPGSTGDIDVGNVLRADAVVYGIRMRMENVVTGLVEGRMFHLAVRALDGRFVSEVEASIEAWPAGGTLLVWRQAYPDARMLSWLTARVLGAREADETRRIVDLWAETVDRRAGGA